MSSSKESNAKGDGPTKPTKKEQSLFEEDDEFEEFPTEGEDFWFIQFLCLAQFHHFAPSLSAEWDERGEDSTDKQLWEDNWDDDNVEDEFSSQLRYAELSTYSLPFTKQSSSLQSGAGEAG